MAARVELTCHCGESIVWVPSMRHRGTHAWVHSTGLQKGAERCYTDGRADEAAPVELDGMTRGAGG
jgi:hypothetical protein